MATAPTDAQQCATKQTKTETSPDPVHCFAERAFALLIDLGPQSFVEAFSFISHSTETRKNQGSEGAMLNLENSLVVFAPFRCLS